MRGFPIGPILIGRLPIGRCQSRRVEGMLNVEGGRTNDGWQYEGAEEDKTKKRRQAQEEGRGDPRLPMPREKERSFFMTS